MEDCPPVSLEMTALPLSRGETASISCVRGKVPGRFSSAPLAGPACHEHLPWATRATKRNEQQAGVGVGWCHGAPGKHFRPAIGPLSFPGPGWPLCWRPFIDAI